MRLALRGLLLCLLGVPAAFSAVISLAAGSSAAGGSIVVPVSFASEGNSVSAVQFDLEYDGSVMSLAETVGAALRDSAKTVNILDLGPNRKRFFVSGLNRNPIADGTLLNLFVNLNADTPGAAYPLKLSNLVGADPSGQPAPIDGADGIVTVQATGQLMQLQPAGILNGASLISGAVAPGEIVTLIAAGIEAGSGPAGVRVLFDGLPAPILYAGPNQVNAVVPYGIAGKSSTHVQFSTLGQVAAEFDFPVAEASPGIFTLDASGTGPGAILNQDSTVNSPSNPAAKGSIVALFAHGAGQADPPGIDGQISADVPPTPVLPVSVQIAGLDAPVQYAGAAPGMIAGILQVNCLVPESAPSGYSVPIVLTVGQAASQSGVTLAIR